MKHQQEYKIENGSLKLDNKAEMESYIKMVGNGTGRLTLEPYSGKKTHQQGKYYWVCILPHVLKILRDVCGYVDWLTKDEEDAHELMKLMFNPVEIVNPATGELTAVPGSTKKMSKERKREYIDSIILWAYDTFDYSIPPPTARQEKYSI